MYKGTTKQQYDKNIAIIFSVTSSGVGMVRRSHTEVTFDQTDGSVV